MEKKAEPKETMGRDVIIAWTRCESQAMAAECEKALRPFGVKLMDLSDQGGVISSMAEAAGWLGGVEAEARIRGAGMEDLSDGSSHDSESNPIVAIIALDPTAGYILSREREGGDAPLIGLADIRGHTKAWRAVDYMGVLVESQARGQGASLVGPLVGEDIEHAAKVDREVYHQRFSLNGAQSKVLASADGLGESELSSLLFQLGLLAKGTEVLIDIGSDASMADLLRRRAQEYDVKAYLFGECEERASLWAVADIVVGVPHAAMIRRALYLQTPFAAVELREDDRRMAGALESLGLGRGGNLSTMSAVVEVLLGERRDASVVYRGVPRDARVRLLDLVERCIAAPPKPAATRSESPSTKSPSVESPSTSAGSQKGPLEAIGESGQGVSDDGARHHLAEEQVAEHGQQVARWQRRLELATDRGDSALMEEAQRRLEAHRARMHAALAELASMQSAQEPARAAARVEQRFRQIEVEEQLADLKAKMGKG
ncbi:MAG: hypothetical protein JRH20_07340 [Deltaproteobacteria bacterium]|nr:hypothetical protein [Deltaproteobacteria bacterium]